MTQTSSDGTPQILSAAGPSSPVIITLDAQQATLPPGLFISLSPDSNLRARFEVTGDRPDSGDNLPANATWVPYCPKGFGDGQATLFGGTMGAGTAGQGPVYPFGSGVSKLDVTITAIRVNVLEYLAGSLTFVVAQNRVPHG